MAQNTFHIELDYEEVARRAYEVLGRDGFADRGLDALCFLSEHQVLLDVSRLDIEKLEELIAKEIGSGKEDELKRAGRQLRFLKSHGIELASSETISRLSV